MLTEQDNHIHKVTYKAVVSIITVAKEQTTLKV